MELLTANREETHPSCVDDRVHDVMFARHNNSNGHLRFAYPRSVV
jgi:hypothetical protein